MRQGPGPRPANAATRAPMWTAMPRDVVAGQLDLAGVDAGAEARVRAARRRRATASAKRIARAGPSKVARKPSPAVSTSRPRKRSSSRGQRCVVPLEELAPAPIAKLRARLGRADDVGEHTVASTRSSSGAGRAPVRNSSISSTIWSGSRTEVIVAHQLERSARPGCAPRCSGPRPHSSRGRRERWSTSVGTGTVRQHVRDVDLASSSGSGRGLRRDSPTPALAPATSA